MYWGGGEEAFWEEEYPQDAFLPAFFLTLKRAFSTTTILTFGTRSLCAL